MGTQRAAAPAQLLLLKAVQLETGVPLVSAEPTPHHLHEHAEHRKHVHRHFGLQGQDASHAAMEVAASLQRLALQHTG